MIYTIENTKPEWVTYDLMDSVLSFAIDYVDLPEDTLFEISFDEPLPVGYHGDVGLEDGCVVISIDPSISKNDFIRTIFHETVHAEQIFRGDLILDGPIPTWKGEAFKTTPYQKQPWEVEAFEREEEMIKSFMLTVDDFH